MSTEEKTALAEEFRLFCESKGITLLPGDGTIEVYTPLDTFLFEFRCVNEEGQFDGLMIAPFFPNQEDIPVYAFAPQSAVADFDKILFSHLPIGERIPINKGTVTGEWTDFSVSPALEAEIRKAFSK